MTGLLDVVRYGAIGAVATTGLWFVLCVYFSLSSFNRKIVWKEEVSKPRRVVDFVKMAPHRLREDLHWGSLIRFSPKVALVGFIVGAALAVFAVGLVEVLP